MILANSEGQLVFLVIMAVIGLINWAVGKLKAGEAAPPKNPSAPGDAPSPVRRGKAETEDERMRRFLEALGVPAGEDAPPVRPIVRPRAEQRPVPPPMPAPPRRPKRPAPAPPPIEPEWQPMSLDELPAPTARVEQISIPELRADSLPEFSTVSSNVAAADMTFPGTHDVQSVATGPTIGETLRAALASPQQLRSAFVLSEVFGPPPGLR